MKKQGTLLDFINLDCGDVFVYCYDFYIKINVPNSAIRIKDGQACDFYDHETCTFWKTGKDMLKQGGRG